MGERWETANLRSCRIIETDMNAKGKYLSQLAETIDQLKSRIDRHGTHISGHETRTRVILIDPLLRSLGWDTEDPEVVVHEYPIGRLKVDYALINDGEVVGILEAKALGRKLQNEVFAKFLDDLPGIPVVAFTDGDEWRFFRKSNNRLPETVKISESPGGSFKVGFDFDEKIGRRVIPRPLSGTTLPDLLSQIKSGEFPKGQKPTRVSFGRETTVLPKRTWKQMYVTVASHLVATGRVKANTTIKPKGKDGVKPLVSPNEDRFNVPVDIGRGLWLEANVAAKGAVANSIFLLEWCGVDPTTARVHFD